MPRSWSVSLRPNFWSSPFHCVVSFFALANASFRLVVSGMVYMMVRRICAKQSPKPLSCANFRPFTSIAMLSGLTPSSTPLRTMSWISSSNGSIAGPSSSSLSPSSSSLTSSSEEISLFVAITSIAIFASSSSSSGLHSLPLPSGPTTLTSVSISSSLASLSTSSSPKSSSSSCPSSLGRPANVTRCPSEIVMSALITTPPPNTQFVSTLTPDPTFTSSQMMEPVMVQSGPMVTLG
mmetsp:Transcript_40930/g.96229  ORF Transcript_40930/g.96229 Transcript_40930/m.96229 type:complete len:236 (+) Transcript_40930:364-1071(+)